MAEIEFNYIGSMTIIQCNINDKIKEAINRFITKIGKKEEDLLFLYGGGEINKELTFSEQANEMDKQRNKMSIIVNDVKEEENIPLIKKPKKVICPECGQDIRICIKENKISLYDCKNGHNIDNILFNEFENTQILDESKIICQQCKKINKSEAFNNIFYKCLSCKNNLCPLCQNSHNKTHNIINYDQASYICDIHNDGFKSYCEECKKDICLICEKMHIGHKIISYGVLMADKNLLKNGINELKVTIDNLKKNINEIITKLNNLTNILDIYFNIYNEIINNYNLKNRNYTILKNINDINDYNNIFIGYMNKYINNIDIKKKFSYMIDLYNEMTNKNDKGLNSENLNISNLKKLYSLDINHIKAMILSDGRLLIYNKLNNKANISIYSLYNNNFNCDINFKIDEIVDNKHCMFQMDDGNIIIRTVIISTNIKIINIKEKEIKKYLEYK